MRAIEEFSLAKHSGDYADWPRTTPLLRHGRPTGAEVPGYSLLRQFELSGPRYLLLTDWDCPYEEAVDAVLLDGELRMIARKQWGVPYASHWLTGTRVLDDGALELELSDCEVWKLEILDRKPWLVGSLLRATRESP